MTIINTLPFQLQNGTTADATQVMADLNQIVSNVNANAAANGANSDITSLSGLTTPLTPAQGGSETYYGGTSGGTANAQTVATLTPTGFTLVAGKRATFIAGFTNTAALTLNINGTGAVNAFIPTASGPVAMIGGEVRATNIVEVEYDGTQYQILNTNLGVVGALVNLAAAATTDLGTAATHNINVTGAAAITAFGSTASTALPIYFLTFVGINTLTYNAASLILPSAANIATAAGDTAVAQYLGSGNWKVWSYQRASGASVTATGVLAGASGVNIANNAVTPNTQIDYTATQAVMLNSSNVGIFAASLSGTINTANIGVIDGIQVARANSTWYNIYFLSNGTTSGAFMVPQGTALSAPAGYTFSVFIGTWQTNSTGNFFRAKQIGRKTQYIIDSATNTTLATMTIISGAQGTPSTGTMVAAPIAGWVPPTATAISGFAGVSGTMIAGPNNTTGGTSASAPGPPIQIASIGVTIPFTWLIESANIYYAATSATGSIVAQGYDNAVNAN